MTLSNPPFALQQASHGAQLFRESIASLLAPAGGIVQAQDFALTQNGTPNMSVNVGAGRVWIPGTSLSTVNPGGGAYYPQGAYFAENDATVNLGISASDPTNPRIDTVICQVQDAAYVGVTNSAALAIVTGTPTAGATLANLNGHGAVPVSSLVLGYVLVPANATTIVTADLSATAGQVYPALSSQVFLSGLDGAKPAASTVKGAQYFATDSNALYYSDGTAWRTVYGARGAVNIATSQSRTSVAYGVLTTPDQVANIVMPANGLIAVWYQATWQESVAGAGRAAIFLGSNQVKAAARGLASPVASAAATSGATSANANVLSSCAFGLAGMTTPAGQPYTGDVTTGQTVGVMTEGGAMSYDVNGVATPASQGWGGICYVFAAAGTYTVGVRFKASSGSVTASSRQLWVQALPFG